MSSVIIEGGFDTVRGGSPLIVTITETGGGGLVKAATLSGKYFPLTNASTVLTIDDNGDDVVFSLGYASARAALQTAFSTGLTSVITVSIDANGHWKFVSNGAGGVTAIAVVFNTAADKYFGGLGNTFAGSLTQVINGYPSRYMVPVLGALRDLVLPREVPDGLATELIANSGGPNVKGIALPGAAYEMEWVIPSEPADRVWHTPAGGRSDREWEIFFRQVRNVEPIVLTVDDNVGSIAAYQRVVKLKADACAFSPELLSADYYAYADIRFRCWYIGTVSP